jgi:hypothetical protein
VAPAGIVAWSIWAGIVPDVETIPAQMTMWDESRPDVEGQSSSTAPYWRTL